MIYKELEKELKESMRLRDQRTINALRNVKAQIERIQDRERLDKTLQPDDDLVLKAFRKEIKELAKAIEELPRGNDIREEYVMQEMVCKSFLPKEAVQTKVVEAAVDAALKELGHVNPKQVGRVIGHVMKNNKGLPGSMVKEAVFKKMRELGGK